MKWNATEIARFARGAGFVGDEITTATAVALATSGGIASYDHAAGSPGAGRYVGLWGIDTDRWPEYAGADLNVPQHAATAAHELVRRHDGWSWHPTHVAGQHLAYEAHAGEARSHELDHQLPVLPFTIHHTDDAVHRNIAHLRALRSMLLDVATF